LNTCDSTHTIYTSLLASDSTFATASSCNPLDAGIIVQNLLNTNNCDSVHTITTTLNNSYSLPNNISICEDNLPFVFPDGTIYNSVNDFIHVSPFNTIDGCDSLIITNLTINRIGVHGTIPDIIAVCESFNISIEMINSNMVNFQWQLNEGVGFNNLLETGAYHGVNTNELEISPLDTLLTGNVFRVVMTDECGTSFVSNETYVRVSEPHDVINPIADMLRCKRDSSLVFVDFNGFNYEWNNGQTGPYLVIEEAGVYEVQFIENETNCLLSDEFNVAIEDCIDNCVVAVPTGFSPQATLGVNDEFRVLTSCEEGFSYFEFSIFNRWGERIFITNNPLKGWDGSYKSSKAEIGVYIYFVEYTRKGINEKETLNGQVTLIR
jgi:gliding motility-associated-like protein